MSWGGTLLNSDLKTGFQAPNMIPLLHLAIMRPASSEYNEGFVGGGAGTYPTTLANKGNVNIQHEITFQHKMKENVYCREAGIPLVII